MTDAIELRHTLVATGQWVGSRGWCPATSGNLSGRIDGNHFLISVSGRDKAALTPDDFIRIDAQGVPTETGRTPSAETLLHAVIYRLHPDATHVVHTHSVWGTVLTRRVALGDITLEDYELLKAFAGVQTHAFAKRLPVFPNAQDMVRLASDVETRLSQGADLPAFALAGHGIYTWGRSATEARRHAEAMEILMECETRSRSLIS